MKNLFVGMALCLVTFCVQAEEGPAIRLKDRGDGVRRDVYLLMGQSNMAGRGKLTDDNRILPKAGIMTFNKDNQWVEAVEPLHWDKPALAGAGVGASFAVEMQKVSGGREIGLVPCAVGGSYIISWVPGGELYTNAIARCRAALAVGGTLKGIIWHQGESDAFPSTEPLYAGRLATLINTIRVELNAPDLPFVAGELTTSTARDSSYDFDAISKITRDLMPTIANCGFVSSEGLTMNSDGLHFDTPSVRTFGERYAAEMQRVQAASK